MKIRYKLLEHERFEDAPFVGCLISAINCHINCKGCFNQHLKEYPTLTKDAIEIIREIKNNPFNNGIVLAGLEWTEQPEEMQELIGIALDNGLKVMLYTGLSEQIFHERFPDIQDLDIFIKYGNYQEQNKTDQNYQYGIYLASSNQYIKEI
jgi:organic radical activating enzyme